MQRLPLLALGLWFVCLSASAPAQSSQSTDEADRQAAVYVAKLAELHFDSEAVVILPEQTESIESEIVRCREQGLLADVNYLRATVVEGAQTHLQYGKTISRVTGVSQTQTGRVRQTQWTDIGTSLQIMVSARGDQLVVALDFENSRVDDPQDPELEPNLLKSQCRTTLVVRSGETVIVSANQDSCLLFSITER